jgi:hypothetical protein
MPTHETSMNMVKVLLKPESRSAMLLAMAGMVAGAETLVESTMDLTDRIYDRYFPCDAGRVEVRRAPQRKFFHAE